MSLEQIPIVYLWVDGSDKEYKKRYSLLVNSRNRDNDDLKYIYTMALLGVESLGKSYNIDTISSLVANTISHYKILIQSGLDNSTFIGDTNISDSSSEVEINNQYKNLWTTNEISIIKSLLEISIEKKSKNENYSKYLESMESILDDKDERVRAILFKTNTNII